MNKSYYAIIPANVRYDNELTMGARLLYGELTALSNEKGYCWATNSYFAELYKVTNKTISNWITKLEEKGYISRNIKYKKGSRQVEERRIYIAPRKNIPYPGENNFHTPGEKKVKGNNTSFNNTSNTIYTFWNAQNIIKHRKLTGKMERKINTTLREYTEEEIKQSIKNYAEILNCDKYWFTYRWTIDEFLSRGLERFLDGKVAKQNHLNENKKESNKGVSSWRGSDKRL